MVLAGPGSGKTFVITKRTQELVEHYGVKPERILVITFTRAAAVEMKERFLKLCEGRYSGVNFGTFHAVFFKIIRYAYQYDSSNIISEDDKYIFLRDAIRKLLVEVDDEKDFIENLISEISLVKNEGINPDNYYSTGCPQEDFRRLYAEYHRRLNAERRIDFDDMMLICSRLFAQRPDILAYWQQQYEYILIDEFQDINSLQYKLIRMLAKPQDNLFIVGDDDQSVYRFRGAKPEIMLGFLKDYPGAGRVLLEKNYRSGSRIIESAAALIQNNTMRYDKQLEAAGTEAGNVEIRGFSTLREQNAFVTDRILKLAGNGAHLGEIAVLFRTNSQPRALIEKMQEYNIPFRTRDRIPNIYEHWLTQDMLAYMELARGNTSRSHFLRVCNRPKRYISRESINSIREVDFRQLFRLFNDRPYVIEKLEKLQYDLCLLSKLNPADSIRYIRNEAGYDEFLREYADYRRIRADELFETLNELEENAADFGSLEDWISYMDEYKEEMKLQEQKQRERGGYRDRESVQLMTFHSAKGLEFDTVFIVDANEGLTPHRKAAVPEDIEEERRMFYVAMTRARRSLYILDAADRYGRSFEPSRFVGEVMFNRAELKAGAVIIHEVYGKGEITKADGRRMTVKFKDVMLPKTLDIDTCIHNRLLRKEERADAKTHSGNY